MKFSFFARTGAPPHRPLKWPLGAFRHPTRRAGFLALGTLAAHVFAVCLAWWPRAVVQRHHSPLRAFRRETRKLVWGKESACTDFLAAGPEQRFQSPGGS